MLPPLTTEPYVSTGHLPAPAEVQELVIEAYARFRAEPRGATSSVYPALERALPDQFGLCVADVSGRLFEAGDARAEFTIMSVSKPFVLALMSDVYGVPAVREQIGANATGLRFNSVLSIELGSDGRTNPMVNPGAIATTSLTPGADPAERWARLLSGLSLFAGRDLHVNDEVLASAAQTNFRNRAITELLNSYGRLYCEPAVALDLYTRQCALTVTATDLAVMGATLADGGVNPLTGARVVTAAACRYALTAMTTAGMYDRSGEWLCDVGLPAKSGIGGGIVTVSPGKGGFGSFAPRLDDVGNSVKGQLAASYLSQRLGLDLFVSEAVNTASRPGRETSQQQ